MPVDLAVRLCLGHSPPIRKLLNSYEELRGSRGRKPLRSCLNQKLSAEPEPERRESTRSNKGQKKKRVVFADTKGLSLTAVRFFSKIEEDLCDLQHALSDLACFRPWLRDSHPEVCRAAEFCISFQCGQKTHWDNNHGRNYKICHAGVMRPPSRAVRGAGWEPLGAPGAAALVLSHLQSWRRAETQAPYW